MLCLTHSFHSISRKNKNKVVCTSFSHVVSLISPFFFIFNGISHLTRSAREAAYSQRKERIRSSPPSLGRRRAETQLKTSPPSHAAAAMACVAALLPSPALLHFPSTSSPTSCSCRLRPAVVARAPRHQRARRFDEVCGGSVGLRFGLSP
jgi:hypothetical protein